MNELCILVDFPHSEIIPIKIKKCFDEQTCSNLAHFLVNPCHLPSETFHNHNSTSNHHKNVNPSSPKSNSTTFDSCSWSLPCQVWLSIPTIPTMKPIANWNSRKREEKNERKPCRMWWKERRSGGSVRRRENKRKMKENQSRDTVEFQGHNKHQPAAGHEVCCHSF